MMMLQPICLAVPITWVARHEPAFPPELRKGLHLKLVSDASPWKLCAVLKDANDATIVWTTMTLPFDSVAFQNIREYLGLLLGLVLINVAANDRLVSLGKDPTIIWEGDNTSALSWAESGKVKSLGGQMAGLFAYIINKNYTPPPSASPLSALTADALYTFGASPFLNGPAPRNDAAPDGCLSALPGCAQPTRWRV
jgi:hypothetical protein